MKKREDAVRFIVCTAAMVLYEDLQYGVLYLQHTNGIHHYTELQCLLVECFDFHP